MNADEVIARQRHARRCQLIKIRMLGQYVTLERHQWEELLDDLRETSHLAERIADAIA